MHDYLDGDISQEHENDMRQHMKSCVNCQRHMNELQHIEQQLMSSHRMHVEVPLGFTQNVMSRLPKPKSRVGAGFWWRKHPLLAAAAIFFIMMSASLLSGMSDSKEFSVSKNNALLVEGSTVTVPENATIKGDLVVKNGDLVVKGKVEGNVTIVNGRYMASTANVTGNIEKIDETFEWLWYSMKDGAKKIFTVE